MKKKAAPKLTLAFDNMALDRSARRTDVDGRLHIDLSHISKSNVCPYYGREIPGWQSLGLDEGAVYRLYRDPVELERGASTFNNLPILSHHVPVTVDSMLEDAEQKKLIIGTIGSDVAFNAPYLDASLCFWDATAIASIATDAVRELSCAYRYKPVMEPGEIDGQAFDGRMTEIRGNHLALVEVGRAGSDVVVADSNPFHKFQESTMKKTQLGTAIFAALCALSPILAADAAVPALVGDAKKDTFKKDDVKAKLLAIDSKLDAVALDNMLGSMVDMNNPEAQEPAIDESPAGKMRSLLSGKGVDADTIKAACDMMAPAMDTGMKKEDVTLAVDTAIAKVKTEMTAAFEAARDVRETVGDVIGMDSAVAIYAFALDHLKVDRKGVEGVPALKALFTLASGQKVDKPADLAQDDAETLKRFPHLNRVKAAY